MSDKELLELAAKASGLKLADEIDSHIPSGGVWIVGKDGKDEVWSPLRDDGDALRLAARLKLNIEYDAPGYVTAWNNEQAELTHMVAIKDDEMVATRRAIVRAAAEIGKSL